MQHEIAQDQDYLKTLTVLYVEDNEETIAPFNRLLSRYVRTVLIARNGAEGLAAYHTHHPDMIITDIRMPVMDGLTMVQEIRQRDRTTPVIVFSAFDQAEYLMHSIEIGIDGYVVKPINGARMYETLLRCSRRLLVEHKLKQTRQALENDRQRLEYVIQGSRLGSWEWNVQTGALLMNERLSELTGRPHHEIADATIATLRDLCHPEDLQQRDERLRQYFRGDSDSYECDLRMRHTDGRWVWILERGKIASWTEDGKPLWMFGTHTDISVRKKGEQELRRLNSSLRSLNDCYLALAQCQCEAELLDEICCIVVQSGGYRMAWIGYAEQDEVKSVRPVTQAGFEEGYLKKLSLTWADAERGRGPTGTAIRTGQPCVAYDIAADPNFTLWRSEFKSREYMSNAVLPLKYDGQAFGVLSIYSARPDAFDAEEMRLLATLADNLAYGITTVRTHAAKEKAEHLLRISEERHRQIADNATDTIWTMDHTGRLTYTSPSVERILGYTPQEIMGQSVLEIYTPASRAVIAAYLETFHDTAAGIPVGNFRDEVEQTRKDGSRIWTEITIAPIYDETGHCLELVGVTRDVSRQKKAKEDLENERETLRLILDSVAESIYGVDVDGLCSFCNRACLETLGYDKMEELIGRNMHSMIHHCHPDGSPCPVSACRISRALLGEKAHQDSEYFWRKDGTSFPCEYWSFPKLMNGKVKGAVVTFIDITSRKHYERDLEKARDAANAANEAKSNFLATMTHELRTPLGVIVGITNLLSETKLTAEQQEYVEVLDKAEETLHELIDDILDLSKIEAGMMDLNTHVFNLPESVHRLVPILQAKSSMKGLVFDCSLAPDVPDFIEGDSLRLRQVILNLVGNAIKFTNQGYVKLRMDVLSITAQHATLQISVTDTGIGIPADKLDYVFENFTQADKSSTRRFGGSGLGLAISKRLIQLMGGSIRVESTAGEGSCFTFICRFALRQEARIDPPVAVSADMPTVPLSILIVDDNIDNRMVLSAYFRRTDHRVECAANGLEALDEIRKGAFDLVFMDMEMPVMDGYEAVRLIREWEQENGRAALPVIALTANALKEDRQRSLDAGCTDHHTKPIKKNTLLELVSCYAKA